MYVCMFVGIHSSSLDRAVLAVGHQVDGPYVDIVLGLPCCYDPPSADGPDGPGGSNRSGDSRGGSNIRDPRYPARIG
jgi:hypothetical protein